MPVPTKSSQLKILHVLTLNGRNGEYGGPVRVARELCKELSLRGHKTRIFSGARFGSEPIRKSESEESYVLVKPLYSRFEISSLWSWRLITHLRKEVKKVDVVHIHFAREMIPYLAAVIAIIYKKPFVTQTHGMVISDGRLSTKFIDLFLTRPLISKAQINFVLTEIEQLAISKLQFKIPCRILPNGIAVTVINHKSKKPVKRVIFCSRLEKRKGISKFIDLADFYRGLGLIFEIYGPDGGELQLVKREIQTRNLGNTLEYKGSLLSDQVQEVLTRADLLVLPSRNEPFPMVILESLAVGTPVLVMPSCGISKELRDFDANFVSESEDLEGLIRRCQEIIFGSKQMNPKKIQEFCENRFSIHTAANILEMSYLDCLLKSRREI
jgi:glycosyltransferase involved in cell wall biosynthesis